MEHRSSPILAGAMRGAKQVLSLLALAVIAFEEWGWAPLAQAVGRLSRHEAVARAERRFAAWPPYAALAAMLAPWAILLPLKIAALWLIGSGQWMMGIVLVAVAKLAGTAIVARMFTLAQPALMGLAWFARLHARWVAWKRELLESLRRSEAWQWAAARVVEVRAAW